MENNRLIIYGRNAVREALKAGKSIDVLYIQQGLNGFGEFVKAAKAANATVREVTAEKLNAVVSKAETSAERIRTGGIAAVLAAAEYVSVDGILAAENPLILIADGIEDPHNLGALIRTAEAAGFDGVIIPKRRSVGVTGAVYSASAGAAAHIKIARVTNLNDTVKTLKQNGIWVYGAEADGTPHTKVSFGNGKAALVIGSEGRGLSRLVRENCDVIVSIPMYGKVNSLNASVSGGILMYAMARNTQNQ